MKINSIKAEFYDKNRFEETSDFIKLCYEYPDLSFGFYWLLRARSRYRLDARIAKGAKMIDQMCPNFCPCCRNNKQWIKHWLIDCPFFSHICSKVNDKILFLNNANNRRNLTNDNINSNNDNSNSNNSNSNNSNSNNSNSNNSNNNNSYSNNSNSNNSNSNNSNSNNSNSNNSNNNNSYTNNRYNNISNRIISNVSNSIENNMYVDSSICEKVFNFLLRERTINNSTRGMEGSI